MNKEGEVLADIILAALSSEDLPETIPLRSIHYAFYELSRGGEYTNWLSYLNFVEGPVVPISEELETAIFRFCSSGLGTVDNPDFRFLRISDEKRKAMRQSLNKHLKDDGAKAAEDLKKLSKDFSVKINSWMKNDNAKNSLR